MSSIGKMKLRDRRQLKTPNYYGDGSWSTSVDFSLIHKRGSVVKNVDLSDPKKEKLFTTKNADLLTPKDVESTPVQIDAKNPKKRSAPSPSPSPQPKAPRRGFKIAFESDSDEEKKKSKPKLEKPKFEMKLRSAKLDSPKLATSEFGSSKLGPTELEPLKLVSSKFEPPKCGSSIFPPKSQSPPRLGLQEPKSDSSKLESSSSSLIEEPDCQKSELQKPDSPLLDLDSGLDAVPPSADIPKSIPSYGSNDYANIYKIRQFLEKSSEEFQRRQKSTDVSTAPRPGSGVSTITSGFTHVGRWTKPNFGESTSRIAQFSSVGSWRKPNYDPETTLGSRINPYFAGSTYTRRISQSPAAPSFRVPNASNSTGFTAPPNIYPPSGSSITPRTGYPPSGSGIAQYSTGFPSPGFRITQYSPAFTTPGSNINPNSIGFTQPMNIASGFRSLPPISVFEKAISCPCCFQTFTGCRQQEFWEDHIRVHHPLFWNNQTEGGLTYVNPIGIAANPDDPYQDYVPQCDLGPCTKCAMKGIRCGMASGNREYEFNDPDHPF